MLLPIVAILLLVAEEPDAPMLAAAEVQARACAEAMTKGDFETLIELTHPKIVEAGGGREAMIETARKAIDGLKKSGYAFESCKVEVPQSLKRTPVGLFCLVPMSVRIKLTKNRTMTTRSALLAFSADDGKTWKFVDTSSGDEEVRKLLPEIPKELQFAKLRKVEIESDAP